MTTSRIDEERNDVGTEESLRGMLARAGISATFDGDSWTVEGYGYQARGRRLFTLAAAAIKAKNRGPMTLDSVIKARAAVERIYGPFRADTYVSVAMHFKESREGDAWRYASLLGNAEERYYANQKGGHGFVCADVYTPAAPGTVTIFLDLDVSDRHVPEGGAA